jgi:hypothetical protein
VNCTKWPERQIAVSGVLALGIVIGIIVVFDLLVAAFGTDSRPDFSPRFGVLS